MFVAHSAWSMAAYRRLILSQVNHLINIYAENKLLVYDYAEGGHRVWNVAIQVRKAFLQGVGRANGAHAWTAEDSLFGCVLDILRLIPLLKCTIKLNLALLSDMGRHQ